MNLFGKEPQERAMATLIHDHNGATGRVLNYKAFIEKEIGKGNPDLQEISKWCSRIQESVKSAQAVVDIYYDKFKKDFQ